MLGSIFSIEGKKDNLTTIYERQNIILASGRCYENVCLAFEVVLMIEVET